MECLGRFIFLGLLFLLLWINFTNVPQFHNHYDEVKYLIMTGILALIIPLFILFQSYQMGKQQRKIEELESILYQSQKHKTNHTLVPYRKDFAI